MVISSLKAVNPTADLSEDVANEAIASAVSAILREGNFPAEMYEAPSFDTVSGTTSYDIDRDMGVIHRVWLVESGKRTKLEYVDIDRMDDVYRYDGATHDSAKPVRWTVSADYIEINPTPDAAYTIAYRGERAPGSLTNIPEAFRDIVVVGALSMLVPAYINPFERGLAKIKKYLRPAKGKQYQWGLSSNVVAHQAVREDRNVV